MSSAPLLGRDMLPHIFDVEENQGGSYMILVAGYRDEGNAAEFQVLAELGGGQRVAGGRDATIANVD